MQLMFWALLVSIVYIYIGYPVILFLISKVWGVKINIDTTYTSKISLIIAAYNEETVIEGKIRNSLELDYPKDKLQIIVASDASTDRTDEIVRSYADKGIELYAQKEHKGKSAALNYVIQNMANGNIVIFTDATTFLKEGAIKNMVRNFSDEKTGAVCGKIFFNNPYDSFISQNEGLYWKYEEFLRKKESQIGVLPFVSGAFYGIRRHLYTQVKAGLPDDSVSPLGVYKKGYRVVFEEEAVAYERSVNTANGEFRIKSRGVVREMGAIFSFKKLLNPFKHPLLSWVIISHRLLRWSVGFFLIGIFITNLFLLKAPFYYLTLECQIILYSLAIMGFVLKKKAFAWRVFTLPFYFCLVNTAAVWGIIQFLSGKKRAVWQPVR